MASIIQRPLQSECNSCGSEVAVPASAWDWSCGSGHQNPADAELCQKCDVARQDRSEPSVRCSNCNNMTTVQHKEKGFSKTKARPTEFHCRNCNNKLTVPEGLASSAEHHDTDITCGVCHQTTKISSNRFSDGIAAASKSVSEGFKKAIYKISRRPFIKCPRCEASVPISALPRDATIFTTKISEPAQGAALPASSSISSSTSSAISSLTSSSMSSTPSLASSEGGRMFYDDDADEWTSADKRHVGEKLQSSRIHEVECSTCHQAISYAVLPGAEDAHDKKHHHEKHHHGKHHLGLHGQHDDLGEDDPRHKHDKDHHAGLAGSNAPTGASAGWFGMTGAGVSSDVAPTSMGHFAGTAPASVTSVSESGAVPEDKSHLSRPAFGSGIASSTLSSSGWSTSSSLADSNFASSSGTTSGLASSAAPSYDDRDRAGSSSSWSSGSSSSSAISSGSSSFAPSSNALTSNSSSNSSSESSGLGSSGLSGSSSGFSSGSSSSISSGSSSGISSGSSSGISSGSSSGLSSASSSAISSSSSTPSGSSSHLGSLPIGNEGAASFASGAEPGLDRRGAAEGALFPPRAGSPRVA